MNKQHELNACPFCKKEGTAGVVNDAELWGNPFMQTYSVRCFVSADGCGATGPAMDTPELAAKIWNSKQV